MIWRFQIYNLFCEILKSRRIKTEFRDKIYIFCEANYIFGIFRSRASKWYVIRGGRRKPPLPLILQKCVYASKFLIISHWLIWKTKMKNFYRLLISASVPKMWPFKVSKLRILCPFNKNYDVTTRTCVRWNKCTLDISDRNQVKLGTLMIQGKRRTKM